MTTTPEPGAPGVVARNPVVVIMSILAAVQALTGAAGFAEAVPERVALWLIIGAAAVQAGVQFYVRSLVTPTVDPRTDDGTPLIPAEPADTGHIGRHRAPDPASSYDQLHTNTTPISEDTP